MTLIMRDLPNLDDGVKMERMRNVVLFLTALPRTGRG
jgi:hypothetical protein